MKTFTRIALVLALTASTAEAQEWFPRPERGAAWTVATSASPRVPGVGHGDVEQQSVNDSWRGWRQFTDFCGLGPVWVHGGSDERVHVWSGGRTQLLADFSTLGATGTQQVVVINDHYVTASHDGDAIERRATPWGLLDTRQLHLSVQTADNDYYTSRVTLARGHGVVGWTEFVPGHTWGFYGVFVTHDVIPPLAETALTLPLNVRDAARFGRLVLVVDGHSLELIDSVTQATELSVPLDGVLKIVSVSGGSAVLSGWNSGPSAGPELHTVDLATGAVQTRPDEGWHEFGTFRVRETRAKLELLGTSGRVEVDLPSGLMGTPALGDDGLLYVPMAYPGSLLIVDPADGRRVDLIEMGMWPTWAKVVGRTVFTDGPGRIDLDSRRYEAIPLPGASRAYGLNVFGERLFALTADSVHAFDSRGTLLASGTLAAASSPVFVDAEVLDAEGNRVLVRVGNRLETVDLR